ncbi:hypothetical protein EV294_10923 [Paenibacillus sp. BK033]|nr:hypothetical protein EV294_10923 [Paenibacillus sp. BK033]
MLGENKGVVRPASKVQVAKQVESEYDRKYDSSRKARIEVQMTFYKRQSFKGDDAFQSVYLDGKGHTRKLTR